MSDETLAVWTPVDRLTQPTRQKVQRAGDREWVDGAQQWLGDVSEQQGGVCHVPTYRRVTADFTAATAGYASIPSLWDQATIALQSPETQVGHGSKPLRERSVADLNLIEIRATIRDMTRHHLAKRGVRTKQGGTGRPVEFDQAEIRRLASLVTAEPAEKLAEWAHLFGQWARALENYLQATEHQVRPVRLRNSACPTCRTKQCTIVQDGERIVVPALVIDFRDGHVRAATCTACGDAWFRGEDMEWLALVLGVGLPQQVDTPVIDAVG
jgi:hypothetical protein